MCTDLRVALLLEQRADGISLIWEIYATNFGFNKQRSTHREVQRGLINLHLYREPNGCFECILMCVLNVTPVLMSILYSSAMHQ